MVNHPRIKKKRTIRITKIGSQKKFVQDKKENIINQNDKELQMRKVKIKRKFQPINILQIKKQFNEKAKKVKPQNITIKIEKKKNLMNRNRKISPIKHLNRNTKFSPINRNNKFRASIPIQFEAPPQTHKIAA